MDLFGGGEDGLFFFWTLLFGRGILEACACPSESLFTKSVGEFLLEFDPLDQVILFNEELSSTWLLDALRL